MILIYREIENECPSLRMTGKRSRCSLPDAACLVGLTSQLDEAMDDMKMMMATVGELNVSSKACLGKLWYHKTNLETYLFL